MVNRVTISLLAWMGFAALVHGCSSVPRPDETLTIYSGRRETLVAPLIERFREASGLEVRVRYGGTAQLAATILEEGDESPADVYFGQDAGALGLLARKGRLAALPESLVQKVPARFRSRQGQWIGTSGRARVLVYNRDAVRPEDLPTSVRELTESKWRGRVGWAPTNGSFQAFVTAMRVLEGDEATREWLSAMAANDARSYPDNPQILESVGTAEIDIGLSNHYYFYRYLNEIGESFSVRNFSLPAGGPGALVNVAGAAVLSTATNPQGASDFIEFLLSTESQNYVAKETYEYPLVEGVETHPLLTPLDGIATPDIELGDLDDLMGTLQLLEEVGIL